MNQELLFKAAIAAAAMSLVGLAPSAASGVSGESCANVVREHAYRELSRHKIRKYPAHEISEAILAESARFGFDPLLVTAVIQNESQFRPTARGRHGEIGLMQIKPSTARWVARAMGQPWERGRTLEDPRTNVRMGLAYLAWLREEVGSAKSAYLLAYNLGPSRLQEMSRRRSPPRTYLTRVYRNYRKITAERC